MGFTPMMATELEFFLFEKSFDEIPQVGLSRSGADLPVTTLTTPSSSPPRKNT
jgi:glutamine synthetase